MTPKQIAENNARWQAGEPIPYIDPRPNIMPAVDTATIKEEISRLKYEIEDHVRDMHDKVMRIRENAKLEERDAVDRAYSEIEPMRRQMEAMINSLADYESLQILGPVICDKESKVP